MMNARNGLFPVGTGMKDLPRFFKCFSHHWDGWSRSKETRRAARSYLMGVVIPGRRKNMSGVARRVRLDKNAVQQFISESPWDPDAVMETNIRTMSVGGVSEDGVLIVDDTGQAKKGKKSPGVKRQYSGTLGKTDNCQVFVGCWYCIPGPHRNADAVYWPTGMKLYVPEDWFEDEQRCTEAGIPPDIRFQTKTEIALSMIERVREKNIPYSAITGDSAYGINGDFRRKLREWEEPYAVAVTPSDITVVPEDTPVLPPMMKPGRGRPQTRPQFPKDVKPKTADVAVLGIPDEEWQEICWSEGTKGKLSASFARQRVRVAAAGIPTDETGWLLYERTSGNELKTYLCWGLDDKPTESLVRIVHARWFIEQGFKQMKGELGLDDFEGRKWKGWHHHAAMVMIAFSYLMLLRIEGHPPEEKLPTIPQVRRELLRIYVRGVFERRLKIPPDEADKVLDDIPFLIPE